MPSHTFRMLEENISDLEYWIADRKEINEVHTEELDVHLDTTREYVRRLTKIAERIAKMMSMRNRKNLSKAKNDK